MIKAIFFDIDGTSFSHTTDEIPASAMKAFHQLKENGYKIGICTSRSLAEMSELPKEYTDIMDAIVCIAGAQIYENGTCITTHSLIHEEMQRIMQVMDENRITYRWVSVDQDNYMNQHDDEIRERFHTLYGMIPDTKAYQGEELVHVLYYTHDEALRDHIAQLCEQNYHISLHYANEILAPGVNKGHGIIECAKHWGFVQNEIAAFGDGYNDVEMIEAAEIGIAMGNAQESLKAVADYVTDDIDDNGLYNACVHFGWIKEA